MNEEEMKSMIGNEYVWEPGSLHSHAHAVVVAVEYNGEETWVTLRKIRDKERNDYRNV